MLASLVQFKTVGLPSGVIETIQNGRAPLTRSLYDCKWSVFKKWSTDLQEIPFHCAVAVILVILQHMLEEGKLSSTIKVYLAAVNCGETPLGLPAS